MSVQVRLPALGESIAEGTIVRWLKAVGEPVERDEDLVVVSTDKIETELPAPASGTLLRIDAQEGDTVDVGAVIALLGEAGEAVPAGSAAEPARPAPAAPPAASPAQAAVPAPGPASGTPTSDPEARNREARATGDRKLFVSPVVRRLARELDVDLSRVGGSGAQGRVTRRDLEAFVEAGGAGSGFVAPPGGYVPGLRIPPGGFASRVASPFAPETPDRYAPEVFEGDELQSLSRLGRAMAEHMAYTWWRAPHVSTIVEVDLGRLDAWRAGLPQERRPSWTACTSWAVARTLRDHPGFNSSLTHDHRRIVHREVNLGVAVAKPDGGLVVPVLHGAGRLDLRGFERALLDAVAKARAGKIALDDLRGGTFTVTNVGSNGNLASMPLINQPQVAILATGAITKRVVVVTDEAGRDAIAIRPRMFVTLTYDHRANDGAASGRFLRDLRERLEGWTGEDAS